MLKILKPKFTPSCLRTFSYQISCRYLSGHNIQHVKHLDGLNEAQRRAVTFPPTSSLQILAGPGTGKTRVLTSRIAEFVLNHSFAPSSICAVTFTKKASREMRSRLSGYIGEGPTSDLKLGTFHALCARYLRLYGQMVGVLPNFLIWDDEECELLIDLIAERHLSGFGKQADKICEIISIIKEKQKVDPTRTLEQILDERRTKSSKYNKKDPLYDPQLIQKVFDEYSFVLAKSKALDFADLLGKGLDVLRAVPWAQEVKRLKHVLVDEFQDTSSLQYLIVQELFKATQGRISVVGDPDQSIYGWRGADNTIFDRMIEDLPETETIFLEENYRSTASNIATAIEIISQDPTRPPKTLFTSHAPDGPKPVLKSFPDMKDEAAFIAKEIKAIVEKSDGLLGYGKFAILFRSNSSPWEFIGELRENGIPFRWLPERTLNDRIEVKGVLAFLRLALNTAHTPMLIRALTGPFNVDKKTVEGLLTQSIESGSTLFDVLEQTHKQKDPDVHLVKKRKKSRPSIKEIATRIIRLRIELQNLFEQGEPPAVLIRHIIQSIDYMAYLETTFGDDSQWPKRNVNKMIDYAENFKASKNANSLGSVYAFLDFMSNLSKPNDEDTGEVTLLTCHSAKGLEWPVVFIPEVVDGVYPHLRADDEDEERRLLYVACTRAQCLLYLSFSEVKMIGRKEDKAPLTLYVSDFVKDTSPHLHQVHSPNLSEEDLLLFKRILGQTQRTKNKIGA